MRQTEITKINLTLPDGKQRQCEPGVSGAEVAASISKSLEKAALAIKLNGKLFDLSTPITADAKLEIITADSPDGLEVIRHDAAHILAEAVKELYPETQVTIGPTIENGFYYDFARPTPFSTDDLQKIEDQMRKIISRNEKIERKEMSRSEAIDYFKKLGEHYKVELISSIPENERIAIYFQGKFADLCRGPHSPSTGRVKAFKLMKVAGAYWRGDSNNEMLQRIYGTAWATEEQLKTHLFQIEEAERRDHRKIGKEMDLYHFQEEAPGMVFWHPKGWQIFQTLVAYMRRRHLEGGYVEISTPEVMDKSIWEQSGHWEKFGENMYTAVTHDEDRTYAIKPMNCPGGVQVYKHGIKSYRDLPVRMAEFGRVHRFEPSGSLHGLMRARAFVQDDAHIFCTPEQMKDESKIICDLVQVIYKDFGFTDVRVKFSDRPDKRIGSDEIWDQSEKALKEAAEYAGLHTTFNPGEGAFYGPKLEFVLQDAIGRDWQLGTLQVDLNLPMRFNANYTGEDGSKHHPVMLHRAIFGSLERFIGILIEHYAGKLPLWIAPTQVVIVTITNEADEYARNVKQALTKAGLRVELDLENEKINYKIRKHSLAKVPVIAAIGKKEMIDNQVSVRRLGSEEQEILALNEFINTLKNEAMPPF